MMVLSCSTTKYVGYLGTSTPNCECEALWTYYTKNACHSCLLRYVGERPVVIVVVQDISIHSGDVKIGPSIIVVVPYGRSHAVAFAGHSGSFRHVRKGSVMIVVV